VIAGPTASGKTGAAVALAEQIDGEIVSADSMQVYKYMDVGTAKPSPEELGRVKHYMIGVADPGEDFSVARYRTLARGCIEDIIARGKTPLLVGGSGFYINAVLNDAEFDEAPADLEYRKRLAAIAREHGNERLHELLLTVDPASHKKIHPNNTRRVIRALEFYKATGGRISDANARQRSGGRYGAEIFILHVDRAVLYERIEKRTDAMLEAGFIEEVRGLLARGYGADLPPMRGLGYKQIIEYLGGGAGINETAAAIKQATRNYAKRQVTWFLHQLNGTVVDATRLTAAEIAAAIGDAVADAAAPLV